MALFTPAKVSSPPELSWNHENFIELSFVDPNSGENITELMVSEGLVSVRREGVRSTPELTRLMELEDAAKSAGKGKWGATPSSEHVRDITWAVENPRHYLDQRGGQPVQAVIEHVRDGSTVRAFLMHDNVYTYVTLMISGIRVSHIERLSSS
jgi:staphylococcal nuclease domain-containing protein 1